MEIKASINKPYTEEQRTNFIVTYNHNQGLEIRETDEQLQAWGYTDTEKATKRQAKFESEFLTLATNKNYRLVPKGYANAQQSIDTVNNMVNVAGSLTEQIATMILFYETPDFTDETQCTEEWLISHQYSAEPMTLEEWQVFYVDFTTRYAQKMYQQALLEQQGE